MADHSDEDKSEKASAQKLRKSREQGQIARSRDWATAVGLLVCIKLLMLLMPHYLEEFRRIFVIGFATLEGDGTPDNLWSAAFADTMLLLVKMVLPLFVIPLCVSLASLYPGGWILVLTNLQPKLDRLNPLSYAQRLMKPKHVTDVLTAMAKTFVLCTLACLTQHAARLCEPM
ncbi:EscU/YscU/HrcU family type III secretion system export apparatus switch protein [Candidatus Dactylopiibacterium carminicum]|uniref:EscU/YscU/HrcU family type III secretion system export apparatus switch protein n=1 Tax=Candidatus Dactylopiibacterium carminicum TaxID=857335 RepID=UPI0021E0B283|nr:EscU/YscU/HrcU family type III secretion system export apparatus switch protein [Candidatus Dactylopiibacterium carminicum]